MHRVMHDTYITVMSSSSIDVLSSFGNSEDSVSVICTSSVVISFKSSFPSDVDSVNAFNSSP